ncbi:MAG TPA: hypothetical protein VF736_20375 [Pyrinomonadaceae bacterium]|jgi:hypothetical protein
MIRKQILALLVVIVIGLLVADLTLYLLPRKSVKVTFKQGVKPESVTGQVTKKERYIVVQPDDGSEEQAYTWEQVQSITGTEPAYTKQFENVAGVLELLAKLGVLAAAGVFVIGLIQFQIGQTWKREEFLSDMVNDFGRRVSVDNAKKMIELLMFYPQGRMIDLSLSAEKPEMRKVYVGDIEKALDPAKTDLLTDEEMRIRECFDVFLSRLERFEHYIRSQLVTQESVQLYLGYWFNTLLGKGGVEGKEPKLKPEHAKLIRDYARFYEFPMLEELLNRFDGAARSKPPARRGWLKRRPASHVPPPQPPADRAERGGHAR